VEVVLEVALFFMEECFFVGEEQFHIARLRAIDGGVVDFVERAVRGGKPDATGSGIRGGDGIFFAGGPTWFESGAAEGWAIVVEPVIRFVQSTHGGIRPHCGIAGFEVGTEIAHRSQMGT